MKKMMASLAFLLALSSTALAADGSMTTPAEMPAGLYTLDPAHASIIWKVSHLGLSQYTARFTNFSAELNFNPKDPTKSTLSAEIDPASVRTDFPFKEEKDFDAKLAEGEEWFNAKAFPKITFASKRIESTGEHTAKIHGDLTLLGVTKPLVLDATFNGAYLEKPFAKVPALGFSATAMLARSDWGFSTYVPSIGDLVQVLIEVELHKSEPQKPSINQ